MKVDMHYIHQLIFNRYSMYIHCSLLKGKIRPTFTPVTPTSVAKLLNDAKKYLNMWLSCRWRMRDALHHGNGIIFTQPRDVNHTHLGGDVVLLVTLDTAYSLPV